MRRLWQWLILAAVAASGCGQKAAPPTEFAAERQRMVQQQLMTRGIHEERVLAAMAKVPREEFVPADERAGAYTDHPLPIGYDQTISQPYIVAFMTEQLHPKPSDRVLEIGTGSGYQAAILAELVAEVYTIELAEPLARNAEATLARLGYKNVHVKAGDGYKGWPENAPFDAIIVTCAPERVPRPLTDQLKDGGRMIIPVGDRFAQELYLLEKKNGQLKESAVLPVRFVPMAVSPIKKDAFLGPCAIEILARVAAQMGEPDRAIAALEKLLSIPYGGALGMSAPLTPALLRLDPMFDPLRNDPRFQKLVASPTPK